MSFLDLISLSSGIVTVVTGVAAVVGYMVRNYKNKQKVATIIAIALAAIALFSGVFWISLNIAHPQIAVNHYTGVSLPGKPAPTEANYNTVVVVTQPATPPTITKTYNENRPLTCISPCYSKLTVTLNTIIIDTTHHTMTWNFTIINNDTSPCQSMSVSAYLEDPAGTKTDAAAPGTLTESTPLNAGQTLQEYTTFDFMPQSNTTYLLHATPGCSYSGDTDQVEPFQFNQ